MSNIPEWLLESLKEFFRVVLLAVIPVIAASLEAGEIDWRVIITVGGVAGLKFIDKALHEHNAEQPKKEQNEGLLGEKGLTGF